MLNDTMGLSSLPYELVQIAAIHVFHNKIQLLRGRCKETFVHEDNIGMRRQQLEGFEFSQVDAFRRVCDFTLHDFDRNLFRGMSTKRKAGGVI